jgi:RimJ/RimL family protein N-acetyltransferase
MNLILRRINKNDINYFIKIKTDLDVCKYLGNTNILKTEDINNWFHNLIEEKNTDRFIISDKENSEIIYGDVCIGDINYIEMSSTLHIKILKEYWGLKIGSNIINKIINYCKNIISLEKIFISINIDNIRSLSLFNKLNLNYLDTAKNFNNYIVTLK